MLIRKSIQFKSSKVISDKEGRYLIVLGSLCHVLFLLVNVYAPNFDKPSFMKKLFERLLSLNNAFLIFGGDKNLVYSPTWTARITKLCSIFDVYGPVQIYVKKWGLL